MKEETTKMEDVNDKNEEKDPKMNKIQFQKK